MSLIYRFKKEKLANGKYVSRPRILVTLSGEKSSLDIPALIDSGCDVTVIPEGIAEAVGLDFKGKKDKLYAYRESTNVIQSKANFTFLGKAERFSVKLNNIPVLIALSQKGIKDEEDIILGVSGVFDNFNITFKKSQNKIILKKATQFKGWKI